MTWDGLDRRERVQLTPEQIEEIAKKAVEIALKEIYANVGKSVLTKLAWLAGVIVISLLLWLGGHGKLQMP